MNLQEHSLVGGAALFSVAAVSDGTYEPFTRPGHALWGFLFLFGNIFPDIANLAYWYLDRKINLLNPSTWRAKTFRVLDEKMGRLNPYKWVHSLILLVPLYWLSSNIYVDALLLGCILHTLIDGPTHDECDWFFPLMKVSFGRNHWEIEILNSWYWRRFADATVPVTVLSAVIVPGYYFLPQYLWYLWYYL